MNFPNFPQHKHSIQLTDDKWRKSSNLFSFYRKLSSKISLFLLRFVPNHPEISHSPDNPNILLYLPTPQSLSKKRRIFPIFIFHINRETRKDKFRMQLENLFSASVSIHWWNSCVVIYKLKNKLLVALGGSCEQFWFDNKTNKGCFPHGKIQSQLFDLAV